jgi:murein DD-endopeptidase MepM/ murein hydrolase activator NlpD
VATAAALMTLSTATSAALAAGENAGALDPALEGATTEARAASGGGGVGAPDPPVITDVVCLTECADVRAATSGSRIEVAGRHLANVETVRFDAQGGGQIEATPLSTSDGSVKALVPRRAATGRLRVDDAYGNSARSPERLRIVDESEVADAGPFRLKSATAAPRKAYLYGKRQPAISYVFEGEGTSVRIAIVRRTTGQVVRSWVQRSRQPGAINRATWDGRTDGGGRAKNGKYRFRIGPVSGGSAESTSEAKFGYYGHKFPVRARHDYWDGFGAGRDHQGQDIGARCGSKLVAARGGKVQWKAFHSAAGYYVVIDGRGTGIDYAYMHLQRPASVREGERVHTGEPIGRVGETGNASGCHLHFEVWSPPGWYEGGHAMPAVTRMMRHWDGWS